MNDTLPPAEVEVETVDNRDFRTTWLWITLPNGQKAYIEVDPIDLLENAVENLGNDIDTSDLQALVDYLNGEINRRS